MMILTNAAAAEDVQPVSDYDLVLKDLESLGDAAPTARYISFADVAEDDLIQARRVTSFFLNSVAALRTGAITRPVFLAGGRIARFQVEWYASSPTDLGAFLHAWERVAESNPYTCFETEVLVGEETQTSFVVGGWIPQGYAQTASSITGSISPMIHFGHFLESLGGPSYYALAGITDRDQTLALLGIDVDEVTKLHADRAATIMKSGVANGKPRRIRMFKGAFGTAWITYDVATLTPDKDAVRHPLSNIVVAGEAGQAVEYDANEYVIIGKNGLPVWLITSADGARQDVVPPDVAIDYSETHDTFNGQITVPISCIRCHAQGGFNDFTDYQQTLMARGQFAYTVEHASRIAETYRNDLVQQQYRFDQEVVDGSCKLATGFDWDSISMDIAALYRSYVYDDVSPEEASRVLHTDVAGVVGEITTDPYLLALAAGESISRAAWHSSAHLAFLNGVKVNEQFHHIGSRYPGVVPPGTGTDVPESSGAIVSSSE